MSIEIFSSKSPAIHSWVDAAVLEGVAMGAGVLPLQDGCPCPDGVISQRITTSSPSRNLALFAETSTTILSLQYPSEPTTITIHTDRREIIECITTRTISDRLFAAERPLVPVFEKLIAEAERHELVDAQFSRAVKLQSKTQARSVKRSFGEIAHDGAHFLAARAAGTHKKVCYYEALDHLLKQVGIDDLMLHCA